MRRKLFSVLVFILSAVPFLFISKSVHALCIKNSEACVEGPETRNINGHDVYQDCWRYNSVYTCDGATATPDSHCQELVDMGCSPVSQTCDTNSCVQFYECNTGTTVVQEGAGCESQSIAVDGLNYDTSYSPSTDLGKAASSMAAVESAVTGMLVNDLSCAENPPGSGNIVCADAISIFGGKDLACRKDAFGFNMCCNLGGWGTDAGLSACNAQEHDLGYARNQHRAHYIGDYCSNDSLLGCLERKYVYCSFTTKIGRIIHEQGRPQLGIGWGSPQMPNCQGFTESELSSINFDLIDFSEYFGDVFANMTTPPSGAQMQSIMDTYINKIKGSGCSPLDTTCLGTP